MLLVKYICLPKSFLQLVKLNNELSRSNDHIFYFILHLLTSKMYFLKLYSFIIVYF